MDKRNVAEEDLREEEHEGQEPAPEREPEEDCGCGETEELRERVAQLEKEIEDLKRSHEKQLMDFIDKKTKEAVKIVSDREKELSEKYRKEFENSKKYMYERQLSDLSQIVSQFENVMNSITSPEVSNYLVGFRMFFSKFSDLFGDFGISPILPKEGEEFNSETMEATSVVATEDPEGNNRIAKVFSGGYRLHERVIKLASVEVSKFEK